MPNATNKKLCFVISPIGEADSPTRKRSDTLLDHIFKVAMEPLGYDVVRADKISEPGSITIQVLDRVLQADIVIADLTDHNPNVFYELAVRHAANKGVIHIICSGQPIPFDVADLRTIAVTLDIPGAARAVNEIMAQAKQIQSGEFGQTPIRLANVLQHLESRTSDDKVIIREMLDRMTELGSSMRDIAEQQRGAGRRMEMYMESQLRADAMRRSDSMHRTDVDAYFAGKVSKGNARPDLMATMSLMDEELRRRYNQLSPLQQERASTSFECMILSRTELTPSAVVKVVLDSVEAKSTALKVEPSDRQKT